MIHLPLVVLLFGLGFALFARAPTRRMVVCGVAVVVASALEGLGRLRLLVPELLAPRFWDFAIVMCAALWVVGRNSPDQRRLLARVPPWLVAAGLMTGLALLRGGLEFSPEASIGQARSYVSFLVLVLVGADAARSERLQAAVVWVGVLLATYTIFQAVSGGVASAHDLTWVGDMAYTRRALPAAQALLVLQVLGLMLLIPSARLSRLTRAVGVALCGGAVLVLQHRSVWLAALVGAVVVMARVRSPRRRLKMLALPAGGVVIVALFLAGPTSSLRDQLSSSVDGVTDTSGGTLGDRREGWEVLLEGEFSRASVVDKLVGSPWGTSYDRVVSGRAVSYSPHSQYITLAIRTGLAGLLAWLLLILTPVLRTLGASPRRLIPEQYRLAITWIVVTQLVYAGAYALPAEQGIMLGVALTLSQPGSRRLLAHRKRAAHRAGPKSPVPSPLAQQ